MRDRRQPVTEDQPFGKTIDVRDVIADSVGDRDALPAEVAYARALNQDVPAYFRAGAAVGQQDRESGPHMPTAAGCTWRGSRLDLANLDIGAHHAGKCLSDR